MFVVNINKLFECWGRVVDDFISEKYCERFVSDYFFGAKYCVSISERFRLADINEFGEVFDFLDSFE